MKALITGGNGFLGRHVVAALLQAGMAVRIFDRRPGQAMPGVELFHGDLLTSDKLESAFDGIDVLIHLAASMKGGKDEIIKNTVDGSRRLFAAMAKSSTRRMVLASSFSVYDWSTVGAAISEADTVLDQDSMPAQDGYAQAKVLQENLARDFAREHGVLLTVLRPAALWGKGAGADFLIGKRVGSMQMVVAPAAPIRLSYVENAADAFAKAAQRTSGSEMVLNVIDDQQLSTWQYSGAIQSKLGGFRVPLPYVLGLLGAKLASLIFFHSPRLPYFLVPRQFEALHKPVSWSNKRLRETLGWAPRFTFDQAMIRSGWQRA